ncbi:hypothetical protein BJX62DRAFT_202299 [Aspergillus germanicus]
MRVWYGAVGFDDRSDEPRYTPVSGFYHVSLGMLCDAGRLLLLLCGSIDGLAVVAPLYIL